MLKWFLTGPDKPRIQDKAVVKKMYHTARIQAVTSMILGYGMYYVMRMTLGVAKKPMLQDGFTPTELGMMGAGMLVGHAIGDNDILSINLALMRMNHKNGTNIRFCPRYLDTVRLAQQLLPKRKKYNLVALLESFGWHTKKKHRAFEDALASYVLLECLLKDNEEKPDWLPDLLAREGGRSLVCQYLDCEAEEAGETDENEDG